MSATALPGLFDDLSFGGDWRRYQKAAIAATFAGPFRGTAAVAW